MQSDTSESLAILCEDGPVLAVNKPAGLLTLGAKPGVPTLERQIKQYLKDKYHKPGNVYLGIPHRLDRPVSGVVLFARNTKAARRLAEQFQKRQVRKIYWAVVEASAGGASSPAGPDRYGKGDRTLEFEESGPPFRTDPDLPESGTWV